MAELDRKYQQVATDVSKAGFTAGAREYAADVGIMLSGEAELQR